MHGLCRCTFLNWVQRNLRWMNLCSKNLEQYGFFDHLAFTLLSNKSCTNLSCTSFFIPQKTCIPRPYCRQKTHLWRSKWYQTIAKVAQLGMFDPLETLFLLVSSAHHTFFNPTSFLRSFISKLSGFLERLGFKRWPGAWQEMKYAWRNFHTFSLKQFLVKVKCTKAFKT